MAMSEVLDVETRRFSVEEYHRMAESGILGPDERVELFRGLIQKMSPKGRAHTIGGARVAHVLYEKLKGRASVYPEAPLPFPDLFSEPQPDTVVCSNPNLDAFGTDETETLLVVEVSDSSRRFDLGPKASLYAEAGIPEYWVVNLVDRVLVVFTALVGVRYESRQELPIGSRVTPQSWPDVEIEVSELFPNDGP